MNRQERITGIQNKINKFYKNNLCTESERQLLSEIFDEVEILRQPISLADFLGWEENVEYGSLNKILYKIIKNNLYYFDKKVGKWRLSCYTFCDDCHILQLRKCEKNKEKKYYAKIKCWSLLTNENIYLTYHNPSKCLSLQDKDCSISSDFIVSNTLDKWKNLGIDETNADFEEVE